MFDRSVLAFVLLVWSVSGLMAAEEDSLRSTYIHKYSNHLYLAPLLKQQNFDFDVTAPNDPSLNYLFKANTSVSAGAAVSIFDVNFEAAFSTSLNTRNKRKNRIRNFHYYIAHLSQSQAYLLECSYKTVLHCKR